jgi:hypothetical protein
MSSTNYIVSGFQVTSFLVKKDKIKIVLEADKGDIRAQDGTTGDVLASLEAYSSSEYPIELTMGRCQDIKRDDE